ncbi:MAG: DUF58 domain-containing protein [Gammaproteobacteria bacterium]|nr:DUF58 domain-containing protein [Gammaproteobacteria bacterium]
MPLSLSGLFRRRPPRQPAGVAADGVAATMPGAERAMAPAAKRFVDPAVLARIGNIDLVSRLLVDGFISGLHNAVFKGVSVDFAEHRPYTPGDDIRCVDWRLYARSDRLYVKTFEAETNADLMLALDVSASMAFVSDRGGDTGLSRAALSKFDYGRYALGCLAELSARQRDRIGFAALRDPDAPVTSDPAGDPVGELARVDFIAPSARRREFVMRALANARAAGGGDLPAALTRLARRLTRRGIVVVLSDFYAEPERIAAALAELRLRGQDVIALHILDPRERDLDFETPVLLRDMESDALTPLDPSVATQQYRTRLSAHLDTLRQALGAMDITYACFGTDQPLDHLLHRFLSERDGRPRRAGGGRAHGR